LKKTINQNLIRYLFFGKKGSPIVEEGLLIGLSIVALAVLAGFFLSIIEWGETTIGDLLYEFTRIITG
jgi:hypothetical protein